MTTIFEQIIAREVPADIVYEDDLVLAFLDIQPTNAGHTLVVPKILSTDGTEIDPDTLAHIIKVGQKVAKAQKESLGCTGVNYIMNNGADAGQVVFHTHLHVIPRYKDDGVYEPPHHTEYKEGESETVAVKLSKYLK